MKSGLRYFLCGLAMGAADVVPGVSGGTIAFISGIYPRLLSAIEAFNLDFFKLVLRFRLREAIALIPWAFLLPLLAGIATSIFSLARGVTYALAVWPVTVWSFFFGLIVASILHLGKGLNLTGATTWLGLAAGAAIGWLIGGAGATDIGQSLPVYFISAFIAICAMILPGISGAFVLVLFGQYAHVIRAVATLDIPVLLVFALGCVCGLMTFARVLGRLLRHYPNAVMAVLTGLMLGSLRTIWPWKIGNFPALPPAFDADVVVGLALCLAGMAVPAGLAAVARDRRG
ncbi:MAG: DUF368 domain-containing protein [Deltaproteobacteria bacterium]|nr:DUF368 domain-containing protein [Deltaproteobacteria bacterium]